MNLVCYPHYAAGGLICNILNQPPDSGSHISSTVENLEHFLFIGDNWTVYDDFDVADFELKRQEVLKHYRPIRPWLGTHCHPQPLDTSTFVHVVTINTESIESQLFRWLRAYNLYFKPQWTEYSGIERQDLMRETAKSYLKPFYKTNRNNIHNIELHDIVKTTAKFIRLCNTLSNNPDLTKVDKWLEGNSFLVNYQSTPEYDSFMQADYEVSTQEHYEYQ
jgi:hypothetical protein